MTPSTRFFMSATQHAGLSKLIAMAPRRARRGFAAVSSRLRRRRCAAARPRALKRPARSQAMASALRLAHAACIMLELAYISAHARISQCGQDAAEQHLDFNTDTDIAACWRRY